MGVDEPEPPGQPGSIRTISKRKVLALSSGGGHWIQLLRLRPAFEGHDVTFVSTRPSDRHDVSGSPFRTVPDANRHQKLRSVWCALCVMWLIVTQRPDVIVSTGALPGYLAIRIGRVMRVHGIWIDSVANADELSMAGTKVGKHVDLWVTQWEHLAEPSGPSYHGSVFG